jgi:hypothetical protein
MLTRPISQRDRVTAIEEIEGTPCLVVLEQDLFGRYREVSVQPVKSIRPSRSAVGQRPAVAAA